MADRRRLRGLLIMTGIEPGVLYVVQNYNSYVGWSEGFAVTPDGEGMHWYDTEEEAVADRLDLPDDYETVYVTDEELEEMRYGS